MLRQIKDDECGLICVRFILLQLYKSLKIACLKLLNNCKSVLQIEQSLLEYGIIATAYKIENIDIFKRNKINKYSLFLLQTGTFNHYIVFIKRFFNLALIYYPEKGYRLISLNKLLKTQLCFIDIKLQNKIKVKKLNFLSFKERLNIVLLSSLLFITSIMFFSMIYFTNLAFFTLLIIPFFGILYFCYKSYLVKVTYNLDKRFISNYLYFEQNNDCLFRLSNLKIKIIKEFNGKINLLFALVSILLFSFLLNINDVILLFICFIFFITISFSWKIKNRKKTNSIEKDELNIFLSFSKEKYLKLVDNVNEFGLSKSLEIFIKGFVIGVFILLFQIRLNQINIVQLISTFFFNFYFSKFIYDEIENAFFSISSYQDLTYLNKGVYEIEGIYQNGKH